MVRLGCKILNGAVSTDNRGITTTFVGSGTEGNADGAAAVAQFKSPYGVAVDKDGNVYVADSQNHLIRKVTPSGTVSTLAGTGARGYADNAVGTLAQFDLPTGVAVDKAGNVYVAENTNQRIRKVTPGGAVSTLPAPAWAGYADDIDGTKAEFYYPRSVAVDKNGYVYVADALNHCIRKVTPTGAVSTLAGTGIDGYADDLDGTKAQFNSPMGVAVDQDGNVYVGDMNNDRIRKVTPGGAVSTLAGTGVAGYADGVGAAAKFHQPRGVAVDASGNVYVMDYTNRRIRKVTPAGVVTTLAGSGAWGTADGTGTAAQFGQNSEGMAVDASGNVYVADGDNHKIRRIF